MLATSSWDWAVGDKAVLPLAQAGKPFEWVEEIHPSPDGERVAAIVKIPDEEPLFTVAVNGEGWEAQYDKIWAPQWTPDGRVTALAQDMGEWTMAVDGEAWPENYAYIWNPLFSPDGGTIAAAVQQDMRYGMVVNGELWDPMYENANYFTLAPDGKTTAAVVQTRSIPQADITTFQEGCFSVAKNGRAWETNFVNAWAPVFDAGSARIAAQVRLSLHDYSIAVDGKAWGAVYQNVWEPVFDPKSGACFAPVRKGKWGVAKDGDIIWAPRFTQCFQLQFSADGANLWAVVAPSFGAWTVACNDQPWSTFVSGALADLTVSPDGKRAAARAMEDNQWRLLADDALWAESFDMVFTPVFSPDSKHLAAKVERPGKRYTVLLNGKAYARDFDQLWDPVFSPEGDKILLRGVSDGVYRRIVAPLSDF